MNVSTRSQREMSVSLYPLLPADGIELYFRAFVRVNLTSYR
ncbi:hypothetical protein [Pontibacterium sinense]|nr:hypothetical protein [Pontibacterium sinense]